MSDDLIKRLRDWPTIQISEWRKDTDMRKVEAERSEAADRIEQLERERDDFEIALDKTMSVLDTQTQFLFQARTNLESVQAKLAKAVEALRSYTKTSVGFLAKEVLAELEGK